MLIERIGAVSGYNSHKEIDFGAKLALPALLADFRFEEINHLLWDELSISYRVCECGCEVYYVHDEGNYFPEEVCVSSYGEPFEDASDDVYETIADAIKEWCSKMNIEQGERTDEEMMDFINEYDYEDDETYFYIRTFTFE